MSKKYQKAKGRNEPNFIQLRHDIYKSEAWKSLSTNAKCVWLEIVFRFNGKNNGEIPLSCREAASVCHIGKGTAKRCFDDLIERGLIKVTEESNFNYKMKRSRRWALTHKPYNNKMASNEWRSWKPEN